MGYQVLARKWRPRTFAQMVGQDVILRMLQNALTHNRIHHAYLFTGTRGVGKTTLARLFAKCLNCEQGITATPCDACFACTNIDAGKFIDLYEIDAASRTKVEDTRELLENVMYPPNIGRFKIYLIDEIHMLSNHSFNALLKTLEEPPAHVKFLLATTDPRKIPITILSRCLQFNLQRMTALQIVNQLQTICQAEKIPFVSPALESLALAADGSMRDALSLLDQAIAYGAGNIEIETVQQMLGLMHQDAIAPLLLALAEQNKPQILAVLEKIKSAATDMGQVLDALITTLHHVAIAQQFPTLANDDAAISKLAAIIGPEAIQLYYQIALLGKRDLPYAPTPAMGFEMTVLRMLAFEPQLPATIEPIKTQPVNTQPTTTAEVTNTISAPAAKPAGTASNANNVTAPIDWATILPKLNLTGMSLALATNCILKNKIGDKLEFAITSAHQPMLNDKLKSRLTEALSQYFNQAVQISFEISADTLATPHQKQLQAKNQALAKAEANLLQNPQIKQLIDMYDATVDITLNT